MAERIEFWFEFSSPYVIVDGEPFWGFDKLPEVERWIAAGGW